MRLQYADFIRKGEGLTESPAVKNLLDANVMYLTVISDTDPALTVQVMTGNDLENGTWMDTVAMLPDGSVDTKITVPGIYNVPLGGVQYVRVQNDTADDTMEVYASFTNAQIPSVMTTEEPEETQNDGN